MVKEINGCDSEKFPRIVKHNKMSHYKLEPCEIIVGVVHEEWLDKAFLITNKSL